MAFVQSDSFNLERINALNVRIDITLLFNPQMTSQEILQEIVPLFKLSLVDGIFFRTFSLCCLCSSLKLQLIHYVL